MRSRKRARVVTTKFHKLTRELDAAKERGDRDAIRSLEREIDDMGGREEYQRASQLSTSFHSTSKWVLGYLAGKQHWIRGIPVDDHDAAGTSSTTTTRKNETKKKKQRTVPTTRKRPVRLMEVGAINTELLDAAAQNEKLVVRAIDLHSMHEGIETADFLSVPLSSPKLDVIVCSMVIN